MAPTKRIIPGPGQESVWDYPRPPRVEPTSKRVRIVFNGETIVDTTRAMRVLETSHPPAYYIPQEDIRMAFFTATSRRTFCEFKGAASYWTIKVGDKEAPNTAWSYAEPSRGYEAIRDYLAFYPSRMDASYVDDELVTAQEGDFYGGWITSDIVGPFKGGAGTWGW
ncbi:MAG: DUF427 domain-containing protein [bacterium]|nr:DUF427 domain-containing protein [bacterium]